MERYYVGCDKVGNEAFNTNNKNEPKEITGLTRLTKKRLKELCKKDKLYQTPALNDVLYLHYQGIDCIECLEEYTGLKCLWLECNAISEIQALDNQKELKCLFLQSNLIKRIENLENCTQLDTLNLASNHIRKIENCGFDVLPVLSTLNLSANYLKDFDGLRDLENCKTLSVLDLSNNRIDDILVVKIFAKMPQLRVLVLQGNPVVSKLPQYRKTLILECKELTYLDSRPVFPKDRACAEAWKAGGYEGERKENERWNRMERKKIRDSVNATIRMRNKHKPPEQQDELFNSSDSEDDTNEAKRQRQAEVDAGISMELGIWEEVVNEDSKSGTSSDMNISSSTSGLSTTDSNANIYGDSKPKEQHAKQDKEEEVKVTQKAQILDIAQDGYMGEILRVVETKATELVTREVESKEDNKGQKRVFIEEISDAEGAETEEGDISSRVVETLLDNEIKAAVVEKVLPLDSCPSAPNLSDSDEATKHEYDATVDAISKITMNDLSIPSPKKRIKLQIEVGESFEEENEVEWELEVGDGLKELNGKEFEVPCETTSETLVATEKTAEQIKYEQECDEVNQKIVQDFEELSMRMDNFFEEMQQGVEGVNLAEPRYDMIAQQECDADSTDSSHAELEENGSRVQVLRRGSTWERSQAVVVEHVQGHVECDDSSTCGREHDEGRSDVPPEASSLGKVGLPQLKLEAAKMEARRHDVPGDHADLPTRDCNFEKADVGNEQVVEDLKRAQDPTNATYESEECALRQLLQKLEDENEQLYNLNSAYRRVLEEDIREEIKYQDKEKSEESMEVCGEILKELIDELTSQKPKSLELGAIESDDEYSYSEPPKAAEPPVHTMRDVLGSFNELLQEIARRNREEEARTELERTKALQRRHATTEAEKSASLHKLLTARNLRDFNGDTSETLDQQIAAEKKRETQRVRKMVDRVYAQKDKYNDTLDVVDGKLVVVKKDTGEIEDLPESKLNYSDSEGSDAYESANSDNEVGATVSTHLWDAKVRGEESIGGFKLPYRPTERISAMKLMQKANALKEKEDAEREAEDDSEADEDNDKFYSLEPNKPATFRNIDVEFIEKLDFEKAAFKREEEADEAVECARSYTELKQMVKEQREEGLNLTDDENVMLQKMFGRAAEKDGETKQAITDALTAKENELLHKMVQRTKEKEKQEAQTFEADMRQRNVKPNLSKQALKILELNNNMSSTSGIEDEEKADNVRNIENLNEQFPIPHAFQDMLDDFDLGTMTPHMPTAELELTVLYKKENNNKAEERDKREVLVSGDFQQPLQLGRGGVKHATYEGDDEEDDLKELDTGYDDVLPTKREQEMPCKVVEDQREARKLEVECLAPQDAGNDATPEQKCERLSIIAANLLNFDGSNYEDYGIDKETARGVVEYEKMLNFGYEEEEEFVDAPMQEEELVKILREALQKDEGKEKKNDNEMRSEKEKSTKQGFERPEEGFRVECTTNELEKCNIEAKTTESKTERTEEYREMLDDMEVPDVTGLNERIEEMQGSSVKDETVGSKSEILAELNNETQHDQIDLEKMDEENMQKILSMGRPNVMAEREYQDLSEEYKDFPVVGSSSDETVVAAIEATETQTDAEKAANTEPLTTTNESQVSFAEYKDFPMLAKSSAETTNAEAIHVSQFMKEAENLRAEPTQLSPKRSPTVLEKRRSLQNLLRSPILKQFNDDTNESLDAQIQAAKEDDFDEIECSLQVIGDNDEIVNEISVNAEITYRA